METTDFEDILSEAASEVTALDPDNLDVSEFRLLRRAAKRRLETAWRFHYWPDLDRIEQRFFAADYSDGGDYVASDFVYYPPTQKYYQALQAINGIPPNDGGAAPFWTEAESSYSADVWSGATAYAQTQRAAYGDAVYQLIAATNTGTPPGTDATIWALLVPFDKFIPYEQEGKTALGVVAAAWSANPRVTTRGNELNWFLSENGVQIITPINFAWLDYRLRCPKLTGDLLDTALVYHADNQVYFSSANTPGNFYNAVTTTAAGETPDSAPAKWAIVPLPRIFHEYLVHVIAADWLRGPGGGSADDVATHLALAQSALDDQKSLLVGQQSQRVKTVVRTR